MSYPLELEFRAADESVTWVPGIELRSFRKNNICS